MKKFDRKWQVGGVIGGLFIGTLTRERHARAIEISRLANGTGVPAGHQGIAGQRDNSSPRILEKLNRGL